MTFQVHRPNELERRQEKHRTHDALFSGSKFRTKQYRDRGANNINNYTTPTANSTVHVQTHKNKHTACTPIEKVTDKARTQLAVTTPTLGGGATVQLSADWLM